MSDPKIIEKRAEQWARSNLIEGTGLKYEEAVEFGKNMYLDAHDLISYKIDTLKAQLSAYQEAHEKDQKRIKELEDEL